MKFITRICREPLVHFMLIGLVVFMTYARLNEDPLDKFSDNQIEITLGDISQMVAQFETTWRRAPSRQEIDALIEARVHESILVAEALALSMDRNDAVINKRLSQKMSFLLESAARANPPSDAEIEAYFEENKNNYKTGPMISFEHVFFGDEIEGPVLDSAVAAIAGGADLATIGQRTLLPLRLPLSSRGAVDSMFGRGFFETLMQLEPGQWIGPIRSGFGVHAVRVTESVQSVVPEFSSVAERVLADYNAASAAELSEAMYAEMRARYVVKLPDATELDGMLQ